MLRQEKLKGEKETHVRSSESGAPAIRCLGVKKYFQAVHAVDGIDLEVHAGECFGLLGPNGAGKTTLVEVMEGLTRADGGVVEILGYRWGAGTIACFATGLPYSCRRLSWRIS